MLLTTILHIINSQYQTYVAQAYQGKLVILASTRCTLPKLISGHWQCCSVSDIRCPSFSAVTGNVGQYLKYVAQAYQWALAMLANVKHTLSKLISEYQTYVAQAYQRSLVNMVSIRRVAHAYQVMSVSIRCTSLKLISGHWQYW
jgi:hypothetical protein